MKTRNQIHEATPRAIEDARRNCLLIGNGNGNASVGLHALRARNIRRKRREKRELRDLRRQGATADEAVRNLDRETEITGVTMGTFSFIDLIEATLDVIGRADLYVATWSAANPDITRITELIDSGRATFSRWLIDTTFKRINPQREARLRETFGADSTRVVGMHAKFALLINETWKIVIRTSMNLNLNPRLENYTIGHDPELAELYLGIMNGERNKGKRRSDEE